MNTLRVGIVGLGLMGQRYAAVVAGMSRLSGGAITLAFAGDVDPHALVEIGDLPERTSVGFDADDAADLDAVIVATPDTEHVEPTLTALNAGCSVLVEKPFATSVAAAERMTAAAGTHGLVVVGNLLHFDPRYRDALRRIAAGEVGDVVAVSARRFSAYGAALHYGDSTSLPWHVTWHDLDLALTLTGRRVRRVSALGRSLRLAAHDHLDALTATLELHDGTPVTLESGWTLPRALGSAIDSRLDVVGTDGWVSVNGLDEGLTVTTDSGRLHPEVLRHHADAGGGPGGAVAIETAAFLVVARERRDGTSATDDNADTRVALELAVHEVAVLEAVVEAMATRTWVEVVDTRITS